MYKAEKLNRYKLYRVRGMDLGFYAFYNIPNKLEKEMKAKLFVTLILSIAFLFSCTSTGRNEDIVIPEKSIVSYLGPSGTYTEEATKLFFPSYVMLSPSSSVQVSLDDISSGLSDYAVVPVENTIGGPVYSYIDLLLENKNLMIIGEVELPIRQAFLAKEGTKLDEITAIYSHPQGIAQGKVWMEESVPQAEIIQVSSTAEGARIVSESNGKYGAVASSAAADVYGLTVLEKGIQQNESNKTRFYVVAEENNREQGERMVFSIRGKAEDLGSILSKMEKLGLSLISLHDRNLKTELGEYEYIVECSPGDKTLYKKLSTSKIEMRWFGAFDTI